MTRLPQCRLLLETEPQSGAWNMAVDEVLLETAVASGLATFRWYRWAEPTLSLGYFQKVIEISSDPQLASLPRVRRLTGGGAILHDREWTYSLAIPARQSLFQHPDELYDLVHLAMCEVLQGLGYSVGLRGETTKHSPEPTLCFSRRDAHDVVFQGFKILGSAQRRRKGAILQHGSLLLERSRMAPEHPGLYNLGETAEISLENLRQVPEKLAIELLLDEISPDERNRAHQICGSQWM